MSASAGPGQQAALAIEQHDREALAAAEAGCGRGARPRCYAAREVDAFRLGQPEGFGPGVAALDRLDQRRVGSRLPCLLAQPGEVDRTALREWIAKRPEIAEQLLRVLARRLRRTNNALADLIFTDLPGRVAKALLQLARQFGSQESGLLRVTHDLTQEEIAQLVGASRETVNKALADFAHRGWLRLEGKSVLILEPERLARRAR